MPVPGKENQYYFVPSQYPFYPKIEDQTKGLPAYGQVFLAETVGTIIYVLVCLTVKDDIKHRDLDPFFYPLSATICMEGIHLMFMQVSGGIFNPAVVLAQICW